MCSIALAPFYVTTQVPATKQFLLMPKCYIAPVVITCRYAFLGIGFRSAMMSSKAAARFCMDADLSNPLELTLSICIGSYPPKSED